MRARLREAAAMAGGALVYFWYHSSWVSIAVHQARDLLRAEEWARFNPIFHGPEISGTGFTLGPFYYWLLQPVLWFEPAANGLIFCSGFLFALTAGGIYYFLTRSHERLFAGLVVLFFIASPSIKSLFIFNQPATFAAPFTLMAFVIGSQAYAPREGRDFYFFGALLLALAAIQIHPAAIVFFIAIAAFSGLAMAMNWPGPSRRAMLAGGLLVVGVILTLDLLNWAFPSGPEPTPFFASVSDRSRVLLSTSDRWSALHLLARLGSASGILLLIALSLIIYRWRSSSLIKANSETQPIAYWILSASVCCALVYAVVNEPRHFRFLFSAEFTIGTAALMCIAWCTRDWNRHHKIPFGATLVILFFALPRSAESLVHRSNTIPQKDLSAALKWIKNETGWTFAEARLRIYSFGVEKGVVFRRPIPAANPPKEKICNGTGYSFSIKGGAPRV